MKTLLVLALAFATSPAFANSLENRCITKQKNAASFAVAQEVAVAVQNVQVIDFENGMWTEATMNNTGSDKVTVRVGNRINRGMTIKTYEVGAKQIGNSDDCKILAVEEVKSRD